MDTKESNQQESKTEDSPIADLELTNEQAETTKAGGVADRDKLQTYIELKLES